MLAQSILLYQIIVYNWTTRGIKEGKILVQESFVNDTFGKQALVDLLVILSYTKKGDSFYINLG